jgi:hypothetical protein
MSTSLHARADPARSAEHAQSRLHPNIAYAANAINEINACAVGMARIYIRDN